MDIERKTLPEQHYIYVDGEAKLSEPNSIAQAMGAGFGEVFTFKEKHGIEPLSMPASIYIAMPTGDTMAFRTGFFVNADDAKRASGNVKAATIPAGDVVTKTHVGPYATLNESHQALWKYVDDNDLHKGMPIWEIYIDDPTTKPEEEVRTAIFCKLGD